MYTGTAFVAVLIQLAIFIGVIVFAVKLINRLREISEAQKSIGESQIKLVEVMVSKKRENK